MKSIYSQLKDVVRVFVAGIRAGCSSNRRFMGVPPLKLAVILLAVIAAVPVVTGVWTRSIAERMNSTVEIALDFDEIIELCQRNNYSIADFLGRCRTIGVASMVINEETLATRVASGKIGIETRGENRAEAGAPGFPSGSFIRAENVFQAQSLQQLLDTRYGVTARFRGRDEDIFATPAFDTPFIPAFWRTDLPVGFSQDKIRYVSDRDFAIVLRPLNSGNPLWIFENYPSLVSGIIYDGKEVPGYPGKLGEFIDAFRENGGKAITVEFTAPAGIDRLKRAVASQIVLGHTIPEKELNVSLNAGGWLIRWERAVRERGVRFVFFHFWDSVSVDENMNYLRTLALRLKQDGYVLDQTKAPGYPGGGNDRTYLFMALGLATLIPLIALRAGTRIAHPLVAYGVANAISLGGGLAVAVLLFDTMFMQKVIEMPLVKPVMLAPVLLAGLMLYSRDELRRFWHAEIRVMHLVLFMLLCAAGVLLIVRSGNNAASWLQPDQDMRNFLENLLGVRPRTKEFLFGQPMLLLGLYYRKRGLLWMGIIGQVSILNTFLHAHTPVAISLARVSHGIWLGLVVGAFCIIVINAFQRRISPFRGYR